MIKKYIPLLFLVLPLSLFAQDFETQQKQLATMIQAANLATDSVLKVAAMAQFSQTFEAVLRQKGSMNVSFDSLPHIGILASKDKKMRVFTWNMPIGNRHQYYGIVQYQINQTTQTTVLIDQKDSLVKPETAILKNGQWLGALYYQLVQNKVGKKVYYTLIGFDFHLPAVRRKLIDVLSFDDEGRPVFGEPLFDNGRWKACRVLLEYSADSPFYLHYLAPKKMIVYQRLQVSSTVGISTGAVPTEIFDGLIFKNGSWLLQKDVLLKPKDFQ